MSIIERVKGDLQRLISTAKTMRLDLERDALLKGSLNDEELKALLARVEGYFQSEYQSWYTEACAVLKQLIPDRLAEFQSLYQPHSKRKTLLDVLTYTIQDWLNGVRSLNDIYGKRHFDDAGVVTMKFRTQVSILESAQRRYESSLFDIRKLLQADLFDTELGAARELLRNGYIRAAGAVAGVVIEAHLLQVAEDHKIAVKKKNPSISDLNNLLKEESVLDIPEWRFVQRLADLRNLCDHKKGREPTVEEIEELINGLDKCLKAIA